jgi:hypothetical protein
MEWLFIWAAFTGPTSAPAINAERFKTEAPCREFERRSHGAGVCFAVAALPADRRAENCNDFMRGFHAFWGRRC